MFRFCKRHEVLHRLLRRACRHEYRLAVPIQYFKPVSHIGGVIGARLVGGAESRAQERRAEFGHLCQPVRKRDLSDGRCVSRPRRAPRARSPCGAQRGSTCHVRSARRRNRREGNRGRRRSRCCQFQCPRSATVRHRGARGVFRSPMWNK